MTASRVLIIAPPPTPNGGMHVGHLSGPYLAADILKRECLRAGLPAHLALSTDNHQTYVDKKAASSGITCNALIDEARSDIAETLERYSIAADVFGNTDEAYGTFVTRFFEQAYAAELIEVVDTPVLFDSKTQTYCSEAFVSGYCPNCRAESAGGICEACGHPNAGLDLLDLDSGRDLAVLTEPRLSLDLERYRQRLECFLSSCRIDNPALRQLCQELMSQPLRRFTMSYKVPRGLALPFAPLPGQQLNVWAEMYPAHFYYLQDCGHQVCGSDTYVQCFGFDNSYFYALIHGVLGLIAQDLGYDWPLPKAFVVNRFYNLGYDKFSTSRGHAIWANDWAKDCNPDLARFYLALHGPGHEEAAFFPEAAAARMQELGNLINGLIDRFNQSGLGPASTVQPSFATETATAPEAITPRAVAMAALARLRYLQARTDAGDPDAIRQIPLVLQISLGSLCPRFADALAKAAGGQLPRIPNPAGP